MSRVERPVGVRLALALTLALTLASPRALAHGFAPARLLLDARPDGTVVAVWRSPPGAESDGDAHAPRVVVTPPCRPLGAPRTARTVDATVERARWDCGAAGLDGREVTLTQAAPGVDALVTVRDPDGREQTLALRADAPTATLPRRRGGAPWSVARGFVGLGVEHIARGADHLAFVLGLVLLARGTSALVRAVTAFTAGHSVTLALATAGAVSLPQGPVEALIGLSIAALALEAARPPAKPRALWPTAAAFGLLHGLGFAGALAEAGVPAGQVPLALGAFNAGVELGQLAFVLVAAAALRALGDRSGGVRTALVHALGGLGVFWFLERVARLE